MRASRIASIAALLSGLVWVVAAVIDWDEEPNEIAYWAGVGLLTVALAAGGYALVATAPVWLRGVVTLATPALGLMVWLIIRDGLNDDFLAGLVVGILLIVSGMIGLGRGRPEAPEQPVRGRRAAR